MNTKRLADYIKRNGLISTGYAIRQRLVDNAADRAYDKEMKSRGVDEAKLEKQRKTRFEHEPLISVIVPAYRPVEKYFREMLRSVKAQTYGNYELIIGTGGGISENTNAAISEAKGEYLAFIDQDDFLEPDALYRIVAEINIGADLIYTDEDKYDTAKNRYLRPFRKPDFDMELLLSNNYVCHFLTVKKDLVNEVGGFRSEYDGAQDHDLIIRCAEKLERERIGHVDRILYHWRIHEGSTAGDPGNKDYAHEAGRRAIEDHIKKTVPEFEVKETEHRGFYRVEYNKNEEIVGKMHLGEGIAPKSADAEERLNAYLAANPDVGAIGGRVIDRKGRILSGGYKRDSGGVIEALYQGNNYRMPGEFNQATLRQEVDIISSRCVMLRNELEGCIHSDSSRMSRRIRDRGYRIIMDPQIVFIRK